MNESREINSELLSADARGRKHIPAAVFAVIIIHIVLFVVLLVAAGCRSSARAKMNFPVQPEAAQQQPAAPAQPRPQLPKDYIAQSSVAEESVMATEPVVPAELPQPTAQAQLEEAAIKSQTAAPSKPRPLSVKSKARNTVTRAPAIYVVKAGDTVEKIARRHGTTIQAVKTANKLKNDLIHPGQKLQVLPEGVTSRTPLQVENSKSKRSNEV